MILAHFLTEVNEANMYVVACPESRKALLIDAACFDRRIEMFIEEHHLMLEGVFITHDHYDHTGGVQDILRCHDARVYAGKDSIDGISAQAVRQDDKIIVGHLEGRVVELPGHIPYSVGLVFPGVVFTGDALFAGSIGGTASERDRALEIEYIQKHVFILAETCRIYPGHGPASTVFIEKNYNPFFA
ncbi:MAG TPA: MBL fold metallo-hydrolase [Candidatus Hydrogenedentes bacterium]|jgi:glyoxylase-like metal-dependent hydrolase (beta-lactamase superfamily II)|nr:MBL fold metallo-hydrolase [Candidatus Hydrogenedentota bacterium]HOH32128.1 MBL fold metallo-hydrolase [Candidatus Hydrogenedentota bacterium]HQN01755.1 MBL fold metallo-hydrolase [Candidatus Hydrogenedentota bacterium]